MDAIVGCGESEFHGCGLDIGVVAGVPHAPLGAFAEDPATFADFGIPLSGLPGEECLREFAGELCGWIGQLGRCCG